MGSHVLLHPDAVPATTDRRGCLIRAIRLDRLGPAPWAGSRPKLASEDAEALVERTVARYGQSPGPALIPGPVDEYPPDSRHFAGRERIREVYLDLGPDPSPESLEATAKVLAQKRPIAPILRQLQEHAARTRDPVPLSEVLPEVTRYTDSYSVCDGPNCDNGALKWHLPQLPLRKFDQEIMHNGEGLLNYYFSRLRPGQPLRMGDLILVHLVQGSETPDPELTLMHTAIYLGPGLIWHKPSAYRTDPWTFERFASAIEFYTEDAKSRSRKYGKPYSVQIEFYRRE